MVKAKYFQGGDCRIILKASIRSNKLCYPDWFEMFWVWPTQSLAGVKHHELCAEPLLEEICKDLTAVLIERSSGKDVENGRGPEFLMIGWWEGTTHSVPFAVVMTAKLRISNMSCINFASSCDFLFMNKMNTVLILSAKMLEPYHGPDFVGCRTEALGDAPSQSLRALHVFTLDRCTENHRKIAQNVLVRLEYKGFYT